MTNAIDVGSWIRLSVQNIDKADLAYLTLSGKIELPMRDYLANWCRRNFANVTVAREWKRHDQVLLGPQGPDCILEGKLWANFNVLDERKLNSVNQSQGIRGAMEKDIAKIVNSRKQNECKGFISTLLMTVDVSQVTEAESRAIKYLPYWKRELKHSQSIMERHEAAVEKLLKFSESYGDSARQEIFLGQAYGAEVRLASVTTKVV